MKEGGKAASCPCYPHPAQKARQRGHSIPGEGGTKGLGKSEISNQEEKSSCTSWGCGLHLGVPLVLLFQPGPL